jgi:cytochrome b6
MILAAFIHMFSVVFLHAYRKPRELTWLSGVVLLGLAMGFGFSGYLLPWNTVSYFATKVGTDMAASVPWIGPPLARFLRGEVGGATDAVLRISCGCSTRAGDFATHSACAARAKAGN